MILMNIPSVRDVGVTLIASAGIAGLAVGAAAQPALKNLIAGIQMAFTEPIRIDDVVVVNGEWGRIEEIRLTYVAVKLWDERRLIVPVSNFLEDVFENWTRRTSQIVGSVFWYVDPATDIRPLRIKLEEIVTSNPRWDGRFFNLQVTDTTPEAVQLRALVTAVDASTAFDLRCDVREAMLAYLRDEMPQAIVRHRAEVAIDAEPAGIAHASTTEPRRRSRRREI
jgi:small-conductance mechanosensitive channel